MSWWQNPGLPGISVDPASVRLPLELELVPGSISAVVDTEQFKFGEVEVNCWTYKTKGLAELGQKEILFALKQDPDSAPGSFPGAPLDFFKNVCQYVIKGEFLDAGSITMFGDSGFLVSRFKAVGYIQPPTPTDTNTRADTLQALLLTDFELEAARAGGLSRVIALMARQDLLFPCPLWNDLQRPEVVSEEMLRFMRQSPMVQFPRLPLNEASVSRVQNQIDCLIPRSARKVFSQLDDLDEEMPMALLTGIDPTADGFLVWQENGKTPLAVTAPGLPGDRLGGSFLCFVPEQDHNLGLISEDGFAYALTTATWRKLRQALIAGQPFFIKATSAGFDLELRWLDDHDVAAFFERRQQTKTEQSPCLEAPAPEPSSVPARANRIELRTHESDINRAIEAGALSAYIQRLEDVVREHFFYQGPSEGFDLYIECTLLAPDQAKFAVSSKPVMEAEDEIALADRLSLVFAPNLKEGLVEFAMEFVVWGGAGAPLASEAGS